MPAGAVELSDEAHQADIVRAIELGEVAGIQPPVRRIDTHLNHIFLAGDRAYKMKRAVKLPFVDFRSPASRRAACEAEIEVNRRLGSPFYLEVAGLCRSENAYRLADADAGVEWVVVMERFDDGQGLDCLATHGELGMAEAEAAAEMVARIHTAAPLSTTIGHAADYRQLLLNLRRTEDAGALAQGLSGGSDDLYAGLDAELARVYPMIEERRARGKVRRVHGDLHLGNLCRFRGQIVPFDALEFDERMATTDVLYDIAFLLMDLRHLGLHRQANAAMNRYWDTAQESEGSLELLAFFMALRAAVRMAIAVQQGKLEEAGRYRSLGLDLLRRAPPVSYAIGGLSGTGKSALAREAGALLPGPAGARIIRSDVLRKRAAGLGLGEHAGPGAYAPERRAEIYQEALAHAVAALNSGVSVIVDATFQSEEARETLASVLPGVRRIWLEAPPAIRIRRVNERRNDASDADAAVAAAQISPTGLDRSWRRLDAQLPLPELARLMLEDTP